MDVYCPSRRDDCGCCVELCVGFRFLKLCFSQTYTYPDVVMSTVTKNERTILVNAVLDLSRT